MQLNYGKINWQANKPLEYITCTTIKFGYMDGYNEKHFFVNWWCSRNATIKHICLAFGKKVFLNCAIICQGLIYFPLHFLVRSGPTNLKTYVSVWQLNFLVSFMLKSNFCLTFYQINKEVNFFFFLVENKLIFFLFVWHFKKHKL